MVGAGRTSLLQDTWPQGGVSSKGQKVTQCVSTRCVGIIDLCFLVAMKPEKVHWLLNPLVLCTDLMQLSQVTRNARSEPLVLCRRSARGPADWCATLGMQGTLVISALAN